MEIIRRIKRAKTSVIWFDNWAICEKKDDLIFWQKLAKLVLEEELIILDTGQLAEMQEGFSNVKSRPNRELLLKRYKPIVGKYFSTDHNTFISKQIVQAMEAYYFGKGEVIYEFYDLFDPLISSLTPFLDIENKLFKTKWGTSRAFKSLSKSMADEWQILAEHTKAKKITLQEQRELELVGLPEAIEKTIEIKDPVKMKNLVYHYLKEWEKTSGNKDIASLLNFFKSQYYKKIPYVDIHAWIVAELMAGNQSRLINVGDYFDSVMISMAYPFVDYMVIDNDMKDRLEDKIKLPKIYPEFPCKIIKLNEVDKLLKI